jgi:hypothetical protein
MKLEADYYGSVKGDNPELEQIIGEGNVDINDKSAVLGILNFVSALNPYIENNGNFKYKKDSNGNIVQDNYGRNTIDIEGVEQSNQGSALNIKNSYHVNKLFRQLRTYSPFCVGFSKAEEFSDVESLGAIPNGKDTQSMIEYVANELNIFGSNMNKNEEEIQNRSDLENLFDNCMKILKKKCTSVQYENIESNLKQGNLKPLTRACNNFVYSMKKSTKSAKPREFFNEVNKYFMKAYCQAPKIRDEMDKLEKEDRNIKISPEYEPLVKKPKNSDKIINNAFNSSIDPMTGIKFLDFEKSPYYVSWKSEA